MIKCKEDLINTAVFCHKGELRELYLKKCEQFGVSWNHAGLDINKYNLLMVDENTELQGVICCNGDSYLNLKRLTLSDLKPRTRTECEKVTESIFDLRDEFERGELYSDKDGQFKVEGLDHLGACCQTGLIYRHVEKEIDWRDEVSSDFAIWFDDGYVGMKCQRFSEENFLEMCRVALRANGEIE